MEHASRSLRMSPEEKLRSGQKAVLRHFKQNFRTIGQLPTGYGKTLTGVACYKAAREAGKATNLLWVVPRSAQAAQAQDSVYDDLINFLGVRDLRVKPGEFAVIDAGARPVMALNAARRGTCELYTATIQSLLTQETMESILQAMSTGQWMLVADEYHHFGDVESSAWASTMRTLDSKAACVLALSATPNRLDRKNYFTAPDVLVSYREAVAEGAVKGLSLHAHTYVVDVTKPGANGETEVFTFTTDELLNELGIQDNPGAVDKLMASKKMRFSSKYVSPMISRAVERLTDLRLQGLRGQMLVQAMSCFHAESLCTQIRALLPEGMRVDWVGTGRDGRNDETNSKIVNQDFCPPKNSDGVRPWTLDVLVNVGIASEGLDSVDVCEIVFCNSPRANPTTLQAIGRAARTMRLTGSQEQPTAHISVDSSSVLRGYPGDRLELLFDDQDLPPLSDEETPEREAPQERDYTPLPDEPFAMMVDVTWQQVVNDAGFLATVDALRESFPEKVTEAVASSSESDWLQMIAEVEAKRRSDQNASMNRAQEQKELRDTINKAVDKVAGYALQQSGESVRVPKERKRELFRKLNGRKKRALGAMGDNTEMSVLRDHYQWVKDVETEISQKGKLPSWLS